MPRAKGERPWIGFPVGHRKTATLVAGLRMTDTVAPMLLDGPINGEWFEACRFQSARHGASGEADRTVLSS